MMEYPALDAALFKREESLLEKVCRAAHTVGNARVTLNIELLQSVHAQGAEATHQAITKRKKTQKAINEAAEILRRLIDDFNALGTPGIFAPRSVRAGDFLVNYSRGEWAENILARGLEATGRYVLLPYGPSTPPMPGESDFRRKISVFELIVLLEGKRPDGLLLKLEEFNELPDEMRMFARAGLSETPEDERVTRLIRLAIAAIEVKSSVYLARKRPEGSLSVTLKEEEVAPFDGWRKRYKKPILFAQVFFDSAYVLNYATMRAAIKSGTIDDYSVRTDKERKTGKATYSFPLSFRRCFADVPFPSRSTAKFMVIGGATIAPYIQYDGEPARVTDLGVVERAIAGV